jgi:hypothetical protein
MYITCRDTKPMIQQATLSIVVELSRLERPVIPEPTDPPDNTGYAIQKRFEYASRSYQNRIDGLDLNIGKLFSAQCTEIMQRKI